MVLNFEQDTVTVKFTPEEGVEAKTFTVKVFAKSKSGSKKHIYTSQEFSLNKNGENEYWITLDYKFYNEAAKKLSTPGNPLPNIIDFSFKVVIDDEENEIDGFYSVHFVRYIAKLMDILKWKNAAKLQRIWFTKGCNSDKKTVLPELSVVDIQWVLNASSHVKIIFDNFHKNVLMSFNSFLFRPIDQVFTPKVKNSLKNEILDQINDGVTIRPDEKNVKTPFGAFDLFAITTHNNEKMPMMEKYYFQHYAFGGDGGKDGVMHVFNNNFQLDDLMGALANFNFHVAAQGDLIYENNKTYVNLKKLIYYVKDNYDYVGDEQELGYWSIGDNTIEVRAPQLEAFTDVCRFFKLKNKDFSDYRNDVGFGYDFHVYSTIHAIDVSNKNIKFNLDE